MSAVRSRPLRPATTVLDGPPLQFLPILGKNPEGHKRGDSERGNRLNRRALSGDSGASVPCTAKMALYGLNPSQDSRRNEHERQGHASRDPLPSARRRRRRQTDSDHNCRLRLRERPA